METGANVLIWGFITGGTTANTMLLRVCGSGAPFNVPNVMANPAM